MTCKGICLRLKAFKPAHSGRYVNGQKRCQGCEIFIKWDGLWCPCCGFRLRLGPRNSANKERLAVRIRQ
jgi:rRNA maturation endonuclease Nob1